MVSQGTNKERLDIQPHLSWALYQVPECGMPIRIKEEKRCEETGFMASARPIYVWGSRLRALMKLRDKESVKGSGSRWRGMK